jgi:hypothetical protein
MDAAITSSLRGGARVAIETADDLAWDDPRGIRAGEESGLAAASSGGA